MVFGVTAAALAALVMLQETDTTFAVDARERLDVSNFAGEIVVRTWARNAVRIQADHSGRDRILVERSASGIRVRAGWWQRFADEFNIDIESNYVGIRMQTPDRPSVVDYVITVPRAMPLVLGGPRTDVTVEGAEGEVTVAVQEGDVTVVGGKGRVAVRSLEGDIWLEDTDGRIRAIAIDGDIDVRGASGEIKVETTDGDIVLEDMRTGAAEALSVDGDISYAGDIVPQGVYVFSTHDGDITIEVPQAVSARVSVATFDGEFTSDFAVTIPRRNAGRRFSFTLGNGDAQIELETFDGDIQLLRGRSFGR